MTLSEAETNDAKLQDLFETLNEKYFDRRLPSYVVIRSNRFGQALHGLCRKRQREIHINPNLTGSLLKRVLLHEMAHAATRNGHGPPWLAEMDRLAKLGAPTRSDWREYQRQDKTETITVSSSCLEAEEHGLLNPDVPWKIYKVHIGQRLGLCDLAGHAESPRAARFLNRIRLAYQAGQNEAKRYGLPNI